MAEESHDNSGTPSKEEVKEFTQADLNKIVSERVNEVKANKEKAIEDAVKKAREEWEEAKKIESLQGEEKMKAEFQKQLNKTEAMHKALEQQFADTKRQLAVTKAESELAKLGLPTDFAENLIGEDDAKTTSNIQVFNAKVNEFVTAKVNEALARGAPRVSDAQTTRPDQFAEIDRAMGFR